MTFTLRQIIAVNFAIFSNERSEEDCLNPPRPPSAESCDLVPCRFHTSTKFLAFSIPEQEEEKEQGQNAARVLKRPCRGVVSKGARVRLRVLTVRVE